VSRSRPLARAARWLGTALAAGVAAAFTTFAASAASAAPRPLDAPLAETRRVPPLPVEYEVRANDTLTIAYHPAAHERVRALLEGADALRAELAAPLGGDLGGPVEVRVAALRAETERLSGLAMPAGVTALVLTDARLVVMSLDGGAAGRSFDLKRSLRHALAHVAVDDAAGGHPVPRWLHEGYATWRAEDDVAHRGATLSLAVFGDHLLGLPDVEALLGAEGTDRELATAQSAELAALLGRGEPDDALPRLFHAVREGASFDRALADTYGLDAFGLERAHRDAVARAFGLGPVLGTSGVVLALGLALTLVRRARRARDREVPRSHGARDGAATPARAAGAERAPKAPRPRPPRVLVVGGRAIAESDELAEILPARPEVPKIEHDGEWHTLH